MKEPVRGQPADSAIPHSAFRTPHSPLVSIVIPSFHQGRFIEATIRSVLDQDYPRIELLVMDGGSTDSTLDVLRRYEHEPRFKWVSEKDAGQSDAINHGFAQTSGEILGWLNSDDTYEPGAISAAVEFLTAHPDVAMVYGEADFIDVAGHTIGHCEHVEPYDRHRLLHYSDFIVQPAAFFRRGAFDRVGGLDASLHWAMDYDLWLKLANAGHHIAHLPGRLMAHYRWLGTNKSADGGSRRLDEVEQVCLRNGCGTLPAYFCLERSMMHLRQAWEAAERADLRSATTSAGLAMKSVLTSPRAMTSLLSTRTWKIIWMGQVLRRAAARAK